MLFVSLLTPGHCVPILPCHRRSREPPEVAASTGTVQSRVQAEAVTTQGVPGRSHPKSENSWSSRGYDARAQCHVTAAMYFLGLECCLL